MAETPLTDLLLYYYKNFDASKREHEDLDTIAFQRQYGLSLQVPRDWGLVQSVATVAVTALQDGKVTIIYPSTTMYESISKRVGHEKATYCSWHEIYVAMDQASKDVREIKRFKEIFAGSKLTLFLGAPSGLPDVIDQVRGFCEGCLIVLN